jgi:hypothetical protein
VIPSATAPLSVGFSSYVAAVERTSMLRRIPIMVVLAVLAALSL